MDNLLLREILRALVLPPGGPLLLIVAGWWCLWRGRKLGSLLLGGGVLALWLLSTPIVANSLEKAVERYPELDLRAATGAQAIVILGAGARRAAPEYGGDAPNWETLQRLAYGAVVARSTGLPVLVTGGVLGTKGPLAVIMDQAMQRDFSTPVRWREERARDTHENAIFSAAILHAAGVRKIILVSSANHLWRAVAEFESAGLVAVPAPTGGAARAEEIIDSRSWIPNTSALGTSKVALYEALGELVRRIRR